MRHRRPATALYEHLGCLPTRPLISCIADTLGTVCPGKRTALHEAAARDDVEAVKLLMKHGAEITATNRSKPQFACVLQSLVATRELVANTHNGHCLFVQTGTRRSSRLWRSTRLEAAKEYSQR